MEKYTSKFTGAQIDKLLSSVTGKAGYFHFDSANNRYLVFTSEEAKDEYLADPTKLELLLGTIVSGSGGGESQNRVVVNLTTPMYNTVPFGSKGNYINYTFDVINDSGMSTGESVVVTYKVTRGSNKVEFKETYRYGSKVSVNVDKYFGEGTNVITVNIMGVSSLVSTTFAVTYDVINLSLTDQLDISKVYDLSKNEVAYLEIPYDVSGSYTKIMEWYIDGVQLDFNRSEDEILETTPVSRTKTIELSNLSQGKHSLQFRVGSRINGEMFYSDILYRDFFVYTGTNDHIMLGVALTIPSTHGVLGPSDALTIPNMVQYVSYDLRLASYSPINIAKTEVSVYLGEELVNVVTATNGVVSSVPLISNTDGEKTLRFVATEVELESEVTYSIPVTVAPTELSITEITAALALDFTARGRSNNSLGRDEWHYGDIVGTLTGFKWNNTSGWVDNRLEFDEDSELHIAYAPLANHDNGKTIELEWSTKSVSDEETIICDLTNEEGTGILIKANSIVVMSAGKAELTQYYKSEENVRMGIVINPNRGTNKGLTFIYTNGIVSRAINTIEGDNYISDKEIRFKGSVGAKVSLKAIRIYNAALTSEQMYNNFTLYRDTVAEMFEVYDRNDIYDGHLLDTTKMSSRLPVMIVTGDIPTLENTNDKDTQIVVDIEYINMQDTSRSFTMKNAAMRPQGTSSMGYPKKNFRIYTQKLEETELTVNGKVVEDRLYSFREGAIPVNCWCLKADYAESSGTHNTGIARLWGDAFKNARVTCNLGEGNPHNVSEATVLRTKAQQAAIDRKYPYDVRTTIDGFPILLFYRRSANDDVVFIGKYNFNNDKSTEAVFGFTDIPGFDNSRMQCWEVLNNGNSIGLFTDISDFYNNVTDKATGETKKGWEFAFEARYPDKSTNTTDLYAVTSWINGVKGNPTRFAQEKWDHLDVYKVAGYYCYLMRHAAADQFVKNAMFTSEDGEHFYYILYDNDTINGLINSGPIGILPTDNRESINADGSDKFAGRDSVLWNMLEADDEFWKIVMAVDNALYTAGISYGNAIKMFDETQADKWVERIYNLDAEYKYITPFTSNGVNNLFMLQGKRDLHRRWWLANRYSLYDSLFVSGAYKSGYVEIKCLNGTEPTQTFKVTSGYPIYYGFGINGILKQRSEAPVQPDEQVEFSITDTVNLGDPIALYGAPHLKEIDLSSMVQHISTISVAGVYSDDLGTKLEKLIIGSGVNYNNTILEISGIKNARSLKYLDVSYLQALKGLDLSENFYLEELHAGGTSIANITFAKGAPLSKMYLPRTFKTLHLTSLPALSFSGIYHELFPLVESIKIVDCPNLSNDFSWVYDWYYDKSVDNSRAVLEMDNIAWVNVDYRQLLELANIGTLKLKGKVKITEGSQEIIDEIKAVFGDTVFNKTSDFYVQAPDGVYLTGPSELVEGDTVRYVAAVFSESEGRIEWSIVSGGTSGQSIDQYGLLRTTYTGSARTITIQVRYLPVSGEIIVVQKEVDIIKQVRPTSATINGDSIAGNGSEYTLAVSPNNINTEYSVAWRLSGEAYDAGSVSISEQTKERCKIAVGKGAQGAFNVIADVTDNAGVTKTYSKSVELGVMLTVRMVDDKGDEMTDAKATVAVAGGTTYTLNSGDGVVLNMGAEVTVSFSSMDGYFSVASKSFVVGDNITVTGVYEPLPDDLIIINQGITDPSTMISGAVNNGTIQAIRAGSHRYLGKYTADGQMILCQLSDADSTKYADGTDAVLTGTEGDVFMKMPAFWYRAVEVGTNMWGIQFQLGSTSPGEGWIKWDTNALIGVYEAYSTGSKVYSQSGVTSSGKISQADFKTYARNRGTGFQIVDWQMHCVMAILFYAQYGDTGCQWIIGAGTGSKSKQCGQTNACGMNDTKGTSPVSGLNDAGVDGNTQSINFWGLENWWGNKHEWIDNVVVDAYEWKITEPDGTVRTPGKACSSNNYITKMMFGDNCDLIPTAASGSSGTGFCDYNEGSSYTARVVLRSGNNSNAEGGVAYVYAGNGSSNSAISYFGSRLAFRGQCVEAESVEDFKNAVMLD